MRVENIETWYLDWLQKLLTLVKEDPTTLSSFHFPARKQSYGNLSKCLKSINKSILNISNSHATEPKFIHVQKICEIDEIYLKIKGLSNLNFHI